MSQLSQRYTGIVKWYNVEKGYGFINQKKGQDLFVHESDIKAQGVRTLHEGQFVEFAIRRTQKGPKAVNVTAPWYT